MQINIQGQLFEVEEIKDNGKTVGVMVEMPNAEFRFVVARSLAVLHKGSYVGYRTRQEALDALKN